MIIEKQAFFELFAKGGMTVTDTQYNSFLRYSQMLVEWNEKCNLTAILDADGIYVKHFYDSVFPFKDLKELGIYENASVIDVGTGAGFPSVPLKIMHSGIKLTLLDSLNKRINFLTELCKSLGLEAKCVHARAEEAGQKPDFREKFDVATARAVATLPELCEYCLPFVRVGGVFLSLKGSNGLAEIEMAQNAVAVLGGEIVKTESYQLPNGDARTLVVVKKISHTPPKYPRNKGQMTKKPL